MLLMERLRSTVQPPGSNDDAQPGVQPGGDLLRVREPSRRRDCHSAAPPSPFSRRVNRDYEGVPAK